VKSRTLADSLPTCPRSSNLSGGLEPAETEPDYRYTLANERTFLAYIRTALGLDAAGLGAAQFLPPSAAYLRSGIAVLLVILGIAVAMLSYRRWSTAEKAMRRGRPLPPVHIALLLGIGIVAVSIGALVVVVANR
jgi:putative membrane protein